MRITLNKKELQLIIAGLAEVMEYNSNADALYHKLKKFKKDWLAKRDPKRKAE